MSDPSFRVIAAKTVKSIINDNPEKIHEIVKNTYLSFEHGNAKNPPSYFLGFDGESKTRIIALPATINGSEKIAGIKWIGSNPDNYKKKLPRASAVIILNDYDSKYPLACLEGSFISATRTAYSAVLAAEHMHPTSKSISNIGIVGAGFIAKNIVQAFTTLNWKINCYTVYDKFKNHAEDFKNSFSENENFEVSDDVYELIEKCDLIVFATDGLTPYIYEKKYFVHHPTVLHISLRDLSPEIIEGSDNYVDNVAHVLQANTSVDLTFKKYKNKNFIKGSIAELIESKASISIDKTRIFSPMGMGVLDLAIANYVYNSVKPSECVELDDFFIKGD